MDITHPDSPNNVLLQTSNVVKCAMFPSYLRKYYSLRRKRIKQGEHRNVTFCVAPDFIGVELNQKTTFYKANFPDAKGDDSAARSYCALKKYFLEMHDTRQADFFAKLELQEERLLQPFSSQRLNRSRKILYNLYWALSDYGYSVWRPLGCLFLMNIIAFICYMVFSGYEPCVFECNRTVDLFRYVLQAIPFMGSVEADNPVSKALENSGWALTILFFHKLLTIIFLFLIGLALRNMFRMK